jgi:hypothetical protein
VGQLWSRIAARSPFRRSRDPWFCLPVAVAMVLDAAVSLYSQPSGFWGDPALADEGNSAWGVLLAIGPWAFVLGFLLYCVAIAGLLMHLSGVPQKLLGMFVLLAHSYGAASWCHVELPDRTYWWALMVVFLFEASAFAVWWHLRSASPPR